MATIDATHANAVLWETYVEERYGALLAAVGLPAMTGLLGTALATYYVAFWGDVIARLFATNAGQVTRFVQESGAEVLPRFSATPLPPTALDEPPPWLREALDEIGRRHEPASRVAAPSGSEPSGRSDGVACHSERSEESRPRAVYKSVMRMRSVQVLRSLALPSG